MPDGADGLLFRMAPYVSFCASFCGLSRPAVRRWLGGAAAERRRVFHHRGAGAGSVRRDSGRLCVGLEMVAVRGDARGGPGGQLRSAAGHVRGRARAAGRHDGPGDDRPSCSRAGSPTGLSSTIRSRSSRSGSISPAPRPASTGPRSIWPRPKANWWPAFIPNIPACAGASSSWPNTARCSPSAGWRPSCSSAAGTARCRSAIGWLGSIATTVRRWHYLAICWACSTSSSSACWA